MNIIELILTGLSLSMDAFSISIVLGFKNHLIKPGVIISFFFGSFQFIMPTLGYYLGNILSNKLIDYQTYINLW